VCWTSAAAREALDRRDGEPTPYVRTLVNPYGLDGADLHVVSTGARKSGIVAHDARTQPRVERGCPSVGPKLQCEHDERMLPEVLSDAWRIHQRSNLDPPQILGGANPRAQ
jgi:hypothetical protein